MIKIHGIQYNTAVFSTIPVSRKNNIMSNNAHVM